MNAQRMKIFGSLGVILLLVGAVVGYKMYTTIVSPSRYEWQDQSYSLPPDHSPFTQILQAYVDEEGRVDYEQLGKDDTFPLYLRALEQQAPILEGRHAWKKDAALAYFINAYNAFTLALILEHWPVNSIRELDPVMAIPGVNTLWSRVHIQLGANQLSLDHIEHHLIRAEHKDARIHFAVNCASVSCPNLRREAYEGEKLQQQLKEQTHLSLQDTAHVELLSSGDVGLSKIFQWFESDFVAHAGSIDAFIKQYRSVHDSVNWSNKTWKNYNWRINAK